jgi:hypothetical protein
MRQMVFRLPLRCPAAFLPDWSAASVGMALMIGATTSWAQGSVNARGVARWDAGGVVPRGEFGCGNVGEELVPGSRADASCVGGPKFDGFMGRYAFDSKYTPQASSYALSGRLGSATRTDWVIQKSEWSPSFTYARNLSAVAISEARWEDRARLTSIVPGGPAARYLDLTYRLDGNISGVVDLTFERFGLNVWIGQTGSSATFTGSTAGASFSAIQQVVVGPVPRSSPPIVGSYTLRVGLSGLISNPFSFNLRSTAGVSVFGDFESDELFTGWVQSAFGNTAAPESYRIVDELGGDATARYSVAFDQGLQFPSTTVPEPGAVGMVAVGLTLMAVRRRRRR